MTPPFGYNYDYEPAPRRRPMETRTEWCVDTESYINQMEEAGWSVRQIGPQVTKIRDGLPVYGYLVVFERERR